MPTAVGGLKVILPTGMSALTGCSCAQLKGYSIVETICIIVIFVISGLVLKTEELLAAIKHPMPLLYGLVAILGITPMMGFATIHIPFQPREFAIGGSHIRH